MVAFMKFAGGITTELISIYIIVQQQNMSELLMDFISFQVISEIDDMMALTLKNINVQDLIRNADIHYPKSQNFIGILEQSREFYNH